MMVAPEDPARHGVARRAVRVDVARRARAAVRGVDGRGRRCGPARRRTGGGDQAVRQCARPAARRRGAFAPSVRSDPDLRLLAEYPDHRTCPRSSQRCATKGASCSAAASGPAAQDLARFGVAAGAHEPARHDDAPEQGPVARRQQDGGRGREPRCPSRASSGSPTKSCATAASRATRSATSTAPMFLDLGFVKPTDPYQESTLVLDYRCVMAAAWPFLGRADGTRQARRSYGSVTELAEIADGGIGATSPRTNWTRFGAALSLHTMAAPRRPGAGPNGCSTAAGPTNRTLRVKSALHVGAGSTVRLRNQDRCRRVQPRHGVGHRTAADRPALPSLFRLELLMPTTQEFPRSTRWWSRSIPRR
jgi:hypothetical protein